METDIHDPKLKVWFVASDQIATEFSLLFHNYMQTN